jgi:arylsulfatase
MRRRLIPVLIVAAALLIAGGAAVRPVAQRLPNFIIVYADDLGYADIGPFSDLPAATRPATPHLDRMAAEGVRLTSF